MTRCLHDMEPGTCSWCTGRDGGEAEAKARDADLLRRGRALPALYAGRCAGCGERYGEGTPISTRGAGPGWRASCCLDDNGRPVR